MFHLETQRGAPSASVSPIPRGVHCLCFDVMPSGSASCLSLPCGSVHSMEACCSRPSRARQLRTGLGPPVKSGLPGSSPCWLFHSHGVRAFPLQNPVSCHVTFWGWCFITLGISLLTSRSQVSRSALCQGGAPWQSCSVPATVSSSGRKQSSRHTEMGKREVLPRSRPCE